MSGANSPTGPDLATTDMSDTMTEDEAKAELLGCAAYFKNLWDVRGAAPPTNDLISLLAHGESTRDMPLMEFLGNILLLIVGGNDTTRNSITGGLIALNQYPDEAAKVRANPALIESMVPEIIRWQTPVAHMRRTAKSDFELGGKTIRQGDKVVMWYVSGNRDETVIHNPQAFIVDRERPRQHLSFGFGIHRCVGMRLAEMQLRIVWEEVLKRFPVIGKSSRSRCARRTAFLRAYRSMMVRDSRAPLARTRHRENAAPDFVRGPVADAQAMAVMIFPTALLAIGRWWVVRHVAVVEHLRPGGELQAGAIGIEEIDRAHKDIGGDLGADLLWRTCRGSSPGWS